MAESSITLTPGQVSTVSTGIAPGTTIYNGHASAAVWLSESGAPGPGSGMRIGPKGSLSWTAGGAVYGAVDTGVTTPVTLTLSPNVGSLVNPVDVGVAVAAQLLATGVPSVLVGDIVASGTAMPRLSFGNFGLLGLDVSRYASLTITVDTANRAQISATFTTAGGGNLGSFDFPVTRSDGSVTFVMPVTGPTLDLAVTQPTDVNVHSYTVYGSNRPTQGARILTGYSQNTTFGRTGAFVAGTVYEFDYPYASNGKPVYLRMVVTGTGAGKFGYVGFDAAGAEAGVDLIDSALGVIGTDGRDTETTLILPPGILSLYFLATTAATYTVVMALVQEH
jgi:hypothetical protein